MLAPRRSASFSDEPEKSRVTEIGIAQDGAGEIGLAHHRRHAAWRPSRLARVMPVPLLRGDDAGAFGGLHVAADIDHQRPVAEIGAGSAALR